MSLRRGARAGSAGFFLLESADVAAMAPGTNAGAAHVVSNLAASRTTPMMQKVENDAEAFLRSYVTKRGRNAEAADAAVQTSHSYTAEEALDQHLIDLIANNDCATARRRWTGARSRAWMATSDAAPGRRAD